MAAWAAASLMKSMKPIPLDFLVTGSAGIYIQSVLLIEFAYQDWQDVSKLLKVLDQVLLVNLFREHSHENTCLAIVISACSDGVLNNLIVNLDLLRSD